MIIEESGRVIAVEGSDAWVVTQRKTACGACSANKACGTGLMAKAFSFERQIKIKVANQYDAAVGDEVILGIDDRIVLRSALLMYLMPIIALILGAYAGKTMMQDLWLGGSDIISAVSGLLAMMMVFWYLRRQPHLFIRGADTQPHILRRG